ATPLTYGATGSGIRSFYVNDDGVIRAADRGGMEATASDPPYDQRNEYNERAENSHAGHFQVVDESSCVRTLRSIHVAEETYRATDSSGNYGTMQQLVFKNLLSNEMLNSQRSGYNFAVRTNGATFEAMATPASYTSGTRSFYIGQEGVIRAADRGGYAASTNDPPYDASSRSY
ncbi:MAG TPA: hypothetical protein VK619_01715, partial [Pyrinomonadaceae bacterium]|nr:hypothetical protein [Pyrinomonadaceae bacterium]